MKKGTNKTDNYFERVKQRLHPPKYRYYFFDYLYFKGERKPPIKYPLSLYL